MQERHGRKSMETRYNDSPTSLQIFLSCKKRWLVFLKEILGFNHQDPHAIMTGAVISVKANPVTAVHAKKNPCKSCRFKECAVMSMSSTNSRSFAIHCQTREQELCIKCHKNYAQVVTGL